jgi:NTF2 fold immunity protein
MNNIILAISIFVACSYSEKNNNQINDFVPNKETAIKIAEAIWLPIYGSNIKNFKPYKAYLVENEKVWIVEGSLKKGEKGGVPKIEINKKDCKILKVSHGK